MIPKFVLGYRQFKTTTCDSDKNTQSSKHHIIFGEKVGQITDDRLTNTVVSVVDSAGLCVEGQIETWIRQAWRNMSKYPACHLRLASECSLAVQRTTSSWQPLHNASRNTFMLVFIRCNSLFDGWWCGPCRWWNESEVWCDASGHKHLRY